MSKKKSKKKDKISKGLNSVYSQDLERINHIPMMMTVELGRAQLSVKNLLEMGCGSVVELNTLTGTTLDVLVNGRVIGKGEMVVVNDKMGIRFTELTPVSNAIE